MSRQRKTVNPLRRPATEADVLRAKDAAVKEATVATLALVLAERAPTVLLDKFHAEDYIMAEIRARCEAATPGPTKGGN